MGSLNLKYPTCAKCGIAFREDEDRLLIYHKDPIHDKCFTYEDEIRIAIDDYKRAGPIMKRYWKELWKKNQPKIYEAINKM